MSEADYFNEAIRYIAEDMNVEERRAFEEFLQSDPLKVAEVEALKKLWTQTSLYDEAAPTTDVNQQWSKFSKNAFAEGATIHRLRPWWKRASSIAAAMVVLIGSILTVVLLKKGATVAPSLVLVEAIDATKLVDLPDGSQVWLNQNSTLNYEAQFEERVVDLVGEAYFEVQHTESDASFRVRTAGAETTVLGTSFNVRAYPNETNVEVDVYEGRVRFSDQEESEAVVLTRGESARWDLVAQTMESAEIESNRLAWKTGALSFSDDPLSKILRDLARVYHFDYEVENQAVLNCTYNTSFNNEPLKEVFEELEFALKLEIEQDESKRWTISGSGCAELQ